MKIKLLCIAALCCIVSLADNTAKDYLKARKRMINREIVGNMAIYTYAQGTKTWTETNVLQRVAVRTAPVKYSKLKLIVAAKAAGKWDDVKAAIQAMDLEDEWNACQFVTSDYPAYIAATNAVIVRGIASEAEVKAFMKQAED
jgi:hypothetical protein